MNKYTKPFKDLPAATKCAIREQYISSDGDEDIKSLEKYYDNERRKKAKRLSITSKILQLRK